MVTLSATDARAALAQVFDLPIIDISADFTKLRHTGTLLSALESSYDTVHVIRHTKSTDWFFKNLDNCDCVIVSQKIVVKACSTQLFKIKALFERVGNDDTTWCCICADDFADHAICKEDISKIVQDVFQGSTGICCSQCGNYVCSDCVDTYESVCSESLRSCPVCSKLWSG